MPRPLHELDDQPGHVGIGRLGGLVRLEGVAGRLGVGLQRAQRQPAAEQYRSETWLASVHRAHTIVTESGMALRAPRLDGTVVTAIGFRLHLARPA